jgi:hypothetical protein
MTAVRQLNTSTTDPHNGLNSVEHLQTADINIALMYVMYVFTRLPATRMCFTIECVCVLGWAGFAG